MDEVFKDLKVVELATVLAGPAVGMYFAEHGAQVIKIENKLAGGDVTRSWKLPSENPTQSISAYFSAVNWGKDHYFLNFKDKDDFEQVIKHIQDCDILIVNFKKGDAEKFGLSYEDVKVLNPQLIYGNITGFGSESDRVAYDLIMQAETGFMSMNGTPDSGPVKMPVALIDILAAHQLKEGILTGLIQRLKTGKGVYVSTSLFDAAVSSLCNQATNWLMGNQIPERIGSTHPNIAPYGELFQTKEEELITFAIGSDNQFQKLCQVLSLSHLSNLPEYANNQNRVKNRKALAKTLAPAIEKLNGQDLVNALIKLHVPAGIVKNVKQVFEDERAKSLLLKETQDGIQTVRVATSVFKMRD